MSDSPSEPLNASQIDAQLLLNARAAIAAKRPEDAIKIWFLKNTLAHVRGTPVSNEAALASAVWLAMAKQRLCPEDLPADAHGLWTLALHNIILQAMLPRQTTAAGNPFAAFANGQQQRNVSIHDILSSEELRNLTFTSSGCSVLSISSMQGGSYFSYFNAKSRLDRTAAAQMLVQSIQSALTKLKDVRGTSILDSRLFDLKLFLLGRGEDNLEAQIILDRAERWQASDWLALSAERRLFLFDQVFSRRSNKSTARMIILTILDGLIEQKAGSEINQWIGSFSENASLDDLRPIWDGERGSQLLALDLQSGFRGRSAIALRRGLSALETGSIHSALRSLGLAVYFASQEEDGTDNSAAANLAIRWISYVAGTWKFTPELISVLKEVLPKDAYAVVFEDLAWRAALRSDPESFERALGLLRSRTASAERMEQLSLLAKGQISEFKKQLSRRFREFPSLTVRFCTLLLDHIESEDAEVRKRLAPVLSRLSELSQLQEQSGEKVSASLAKVSTRAQQILRAIEPGLSDISENKSRSYNPRDGVFVGNIRLKPATALPWPYTPPVSSAPQPFSPLVIVPESWTTDGRTVLGWKIVE